MTSAFASRAVRFRTMTQLIALTAFVTMGMVLLALYHYKHLPELGYFLLYLVIMSVWALMVFFFPAIRNSLLQLILRSFFSLTVLASALLAAGLLVFLIFSLNKGSIRYLSASALSFFIISDSVMVKSLPLPVVAVAYQLAENHTPQNLIIAIFPALWMSA